MITMEDIARISGVARSTVHAVLTDKDWPSEQMRQKVMTVVKKYNYQPNRMAKSLKGAQTQLIGLIVKDISNPFYSRLVDGVSDILSKNNYHALYYSTRENHDEEN